MKDPKVTALTITCEAAPTQAEGMLSDGTYFYFRARHRSIELRISTDSPGAAVASSDAIGLKITGYESDGHPLSYMHEEEVRSMVEFLARVKQGCEDYQNR